MPKIARLCLNVSKLCPKYCGSLWPLFFRTRCIIYNNRKTAYYGSSCIYMHTINYKRLNTNQIISPLTTILFIRFIVALRPAITQLRLWNTAVLAVDRAFELARVTAHRTHRRICKHLQRRTSIGNYHRLLLLQL